VRRVVWYLVTRNSLRYVCVLHCYLSRFLIHTIVIELHDWSFYCSDRKSEIRTRSEFKCQVKLRSKADTEHASIKVPLIVVSYVGMDNKPSCSRLETLVVRQTPA